MNANEVVANLALEFMGHRRGEYHLLHPIDDVNMAQSTNDAYPTALRLAVIFATVPLVRALQELAYAFKAKAVEFADVLKMGRTQLQDAVPMTLGQEFDGFHTTVKEDIDRLREAAALFREVNLGATAIGTGITADPRCWRFRFHFSVLPRCFSGFVLKLVGYRACGVIIRTRVLVIILSAAKACQCVQGLLTEARRNELLRLDALTRPSRFVMADTAKPDSARFVGAAISLPSASRISRRTGRSRRSPNIFLYPGP